MQSFAILSEGHEASAHRQQYTGHAILEASKNSTRRAAWLILKPQPLVWRRTFHDFEKNVALVASLLLGAAALFGVVLVTLVTTATMSGLKVRLGSVESRATSHAVESRNATASQQAQIQAMQAQIAETRFPPPLFIDAQALFHEARYADAEAAYARFLLEFPTSRLRDLALLNSALANALLRNCSMVRARLHLLRKEYPQSLSASKQAHIVATCESHSNGR